MPTYAFDPFNISFLQYFILHEQNLRLSNVVGIKRSGTKYLFVYRSDCDCAAQMGQDDRSDGEEWAAGDIRQVADRAVHTTTRQGMSGKTLVPVPVLPRLKQISCDKFGTT
jgi:hypothetical protein